VSAGRDADTRSPAARWRREQAHVTRVLRQRDAIRQEIEAATAPWTMEERLGQIFAPPEPPEPTALTPVPARLDAPRPVPARPGRRRWRRHL